MATKAEKYKEFYKRKFEEQVDKYRSNGKIVITNELILFMSKMAAFFDEQEPIAMQLYRDRQLFIFNDKSALIFIIEGDKYGFFATNVKRLEEISEEIRKEREKKRGNNGKNK